MLVVNTHGAGHVAFEEARAAYASRPETFVFEVASGGAAAGARTPAASRNTPDARVRKQTRDIVTVLRLARGRATYFLISEDDMRLCVYGATVAAYLLDRASRAQPDWIAIRASFGMNGIFLKDADLGSLADYLEKHQNRRPPDHLVVEWYGGETDESALYRGTRHNLGFKYNIFDHIGATSTLRSQRKAPLMPLCYEDLLVPVVFPVEAYDPRKCPTFDISPCQFKHPEDLKPTIDWSHLRNAGTPP